MKVEELKRQKFLESISTKTIKPLVLAIDFDGTLIGNTDWHYRTFNPIEIFAGPEWGFYIKTIDIVKHWKSLGHFLILWTCRADNVYEGYDDSLTDAIRWSKSQGLEYDLVNEDKPEYFRNTRKILFDYCIDDKCCNIHNIENWNMKNWNINFFT